MYVVYEYNNHTVQNTVILVVLMKHIDNSKYSHILTMTKLVLALVVASLSTTDDPRLPTEAGMAVVKRNVQR